MKRVLVAGAGGAFGGLIASRLAERGIATTPLAVDVEDRGALAVALREGDIVVDAAGPFQHRTTALVEAADAAGCDVVDIADALSYAEQVLAVPLTRARVFPACSAVAAVAASCVRLTAVERPRRVDIFLAPAARVTAGGATARSFISSVGAPIRVLERGALRARTGWHRSRRFPLARRTGREVESAAALLLARAWPLLEDVGFWVDANVPASGLVLAILARVPAARALAPALFPLARALGSARGVFAVQVDDGRAVSLEGERRSHVIAAEPAAMAVESLLAGRRDPPGIIAPDSQVDPEMLIARLAALGVRVRSG